MPLVTCTRMLDAMLVRRLLTAADRADLVLVVSEAVYDSVVRQGYGLDPATFRAARIVEKETDATVWIHIPGYAVPADPDDGSRRAATDRSAPPGPTSAPGAALAGDVPTRVQATAAGELTGEPPLAPVAVGWGYVSMPSGSGLSPLLAETWGSRQVQQALEQGGPGTVVGIARQAHGLHQTQLADMAGLSQYAICELEKGNGDLAHDIRVLRRLQRLLGIPPHLLGLSDESLPLRPDDAKRLFAHIAPDQVAFQGRTPDGHIVPVAIDRHTLLSLSMSAVLGAPSVDAFEFLDDNRPLDPAMLRRLRVIRRLFNESDNWLGPGSLLPAVRRMYEFIDRARRSAKGDFRRQLLHVAALYAEFFGWLRQEMGDLDSATTWTERALQQAHAADDHDLIAYSYVRLGQLAEAERDDDRVIGLARAAQRYDGLAPQVSALVLQQEARGHAIAGSEHACLAALDKARTTLAGIRPRWTDEYEVGFFFDQPRLDANRAGCLLELGRPAEAVTAYQTTLGALICRWEQGLHLAKLARAYALNREPDQAVAVGFQALTIGQETGTTMIIDELRRLPACRHLAALHEALNARD